MSEQASLMNSEEPTKPNRRLPKKKSKVDLGKALVLRHKFQLTNAQIARYLGCSESTISEGLKELMKYMPSMEDLESFRKVKGDILEGVQWQILSSLSDSDSLEKASYLQRATAFAVIYDKLRLELGKSTENLNVIQYLTLMKDKVAPAESAKESNQIVDLLESAQDSQSSAAPETETKSDTSE